MSKEKMVLAFDQARTSGFAYGRLGSDPKSGIIKIGKHDSKEHLYWLYQVELGRLVDRVQPDVVAMELPFFNRKRPTAAVDLYHAAGAVKAMLYDRRVSEVLDVQNGAWKKLLCGANTFTKETRPYPPVDACGLRGWKTGDSNDRADALGIWLFTCNRLAPELNLSLPIFNQ